MVLWPVPGCLAADACICEKSVSPISELGGLRSVRLKESQLRSSHRLLVPRSQVGYVEGTGLHEGSKRISACGAEEGFPQCGKGPVMLIVLFDEQGEKTKAEQTTLSPSPSTSVIWPMTGVTPVRAMLNT